jgi:DNA-binding CsgD family transcriptional regulator/PAS domain-containing protein
MRAGLIDEQLIAALYDTALYGGDWQPALDRFRVLLNSAEGSLCDLKHEIQDTGTHVSGHLLTPDVREPYMRYYGRIDPKLRVLYRHKVNYLFNDARHFDAEFVARNPFYQEYTRSLGMRHTLDMTIGRDDSSERFLAVMRAPSRGPYGARDEGLFRQCAQHFLRVLKLKDRIDAAQQLGKLAAAALDSLRSAALVVDRHGCVLLNNRAAESVCAAGEELQMRNGKLTARSAKTAERLQCAIRQAAGGHGTAEVLHLSCAGDADRIAWIAPLPAERNVVESPGAIILVGEPAGCRSADADAVAAIYGLTAAEARIAVAIGGGATLAETAAERGVKLSTVRSQLLSVLQKTGARRQADLARMLANLPGTLLRH